MTLVTRKLTEPRLAHSAMPASTSLDAPQTHTRAMRWTGLTLVVLLAGLALLVLPGNAPLRHPDTGSVLGSPFIHGLVVIVALIAGICGAVYGRVSGQFRNSGDIITAMETTMASMAGYLVLMFFAAQFVAWFNYSQLGLLLAVKGAAWLGALTVPKVVLLLLFVVLTALINLMIGSASAKWSILAPVFIPMLMLLGISPRSQPSGLPGRRFQHQYHHAADALLRTGTGLRQALSTGNGHRHIDCPNAALQPDTAAGLVGAVRRVDRVWLATGTVKAATSFELLAATRRNASDRLQIECPRSNSKKTRQKARFLLVASS